MLKALGDKYTRVSLVGGWVHSWWKADALGDKYTRVSLVVGGWVGGYIGGGKRMLKALGDKYTRVSLHRWEGGWGMGYGVDKAQSIGWLH